MNHCARFIILSLLFTSVTGCGRFREMTRRDYTLLRDPFAAGNLDEDQLADAGAPPVPGATPSKAGFVSLTDTTPGPAIADYSNVEQAAPIDPGRSSTRITAGSVHKMPDAARSEFDTSNSAAFRSPPVPQPIQTAAAENQTNPPPDMAEMAAFIGSQARASGLTDTADEAQADFAEFVTRRQQQWKEQVSQVQDKAAPLISPIQQVSQAVEQPASASGPRTVDFDGVSSLSAAKPSAAAEAATPLIRNTPAKTTNEPNLFSGASAPPIAAFPARKPLQNMAAAPPEPPVFDSPSAFDSPSHAPAPTSNAATEQNPFSAFEKQSATESAAAGDTLDADFNFDSGWRPTSAVHP